MDSLEIRIAQDQPASSSSVAEERPLSPDDHRKWVLLVRRLDEALTLLEALDAGSSQNAGFVQSALDAAKRELRRRRSGRRQAVYRRIIHGIFSTVRH